MIEDRACRTALWELEKRGYVEYHENDTDIDSHLSSFRQRSSQVEKKGEDTWPYWRIRRPGLSATLRAWGVPAGAEFGQRSERNRLLDRFIEGGHDSGRNGLAKLYRMPKSMQAEVKLAFQD